jgi:hypothetical protein
MGAGFLLLREVPYAYPVYVVNERRGACCKPSKKGTSFAKFCHSVFAGSGGSRDKTGPWQQAGSYLSKCGRSEIVG